MYISTGPDEVNVPEVRGLTRDAAITELETRARSLAPSRQDHDPDIQADRATKTEPAAGQIVAPGDEVTLYISDGKVELPELRGGTEAEARQTLGRTGADRRPAGRRDHRGRPRHGGGAGPASRPGRPRIDGDLQGRQGAHHGRGSQRGRQDQSAGAKRRCRAAGLNTNVTQQNSANGPVGHGDLAEPVRGNQGRGRHHGDHHRVVGTAAHTPPTPGPYARRGRPCAGQGRARVAWVSKGRSRSCGRAERGSRWRCLPRTMVEFSGNDCAFSGVLSGTMTGLLTTDALQEFVASRLDAVQATLDDHVIAATAELPHARPALPQPVADARQPVRRRQEPAALAHPRGLRRARRRGRRGDPARGRRHGDAAPGDAGPRRRPGPRRGAPRPTQRGGHSASGTRALAARRPPGGRPRDGGRAAGGDLALSSAYDLISRAPLPAHHRLACLDLVTRAIRTTIAGELLDMYGDLIDPADANSLLVAELKTATYSCVVPLRAGRATGRRGPHDGRVTWSDWVPRSACRSSWWTTTSACSATPSVTGKSVLSDLRAGKRTELMRLGFHTTDDAGREVLRASVGQPGPGRGRRAPPCARCSSTRGARARALKVARQHARTARSASRRSASPRRCRATSSGSSTPWRSARREQGAAGAGGRVHHDNDTSLALYDATRAGGGRRGLATSTRRPLALAPGCSGARCAPTFARSTRWCASPTRSWTPTGARTRARCSTASSATSTTPSTSTFSANLVAHAFAVSARHVGIGRDLTEPFFASMRMDLDTTEHTPGELRPLRVRLRRGGRRDVPGGVPQHATPGRARCPPTCARAPGGWAPPTRRSTFCGPRHGRRASSGARTFPA